MRLLIIAIALAIFISGAAVNYSLHATQPPVIDSLLSFQATSSSIIQDLQPTSIPSNSPTILPTRIPTRIPTPSNAPANNPLILYPNRVHVQTTSTSVQFDSYDTPEQIRNWYQQQIKDRHMNTTSLVNTITNGSTHISLTATSGSDTISVTIRKLSSDDITHIEIEM